MIEDIKNQNIKIFESQINCKIDYIGTGKKTLIKLWWNGIFLIFKYILL